MNSALGSRPKVALKYHLLPLRCLLIFPGLQSTHSKANPGWAWTRGRGSELWSLRTSPCTAEFSTFSLCGLGGATGQAQGFSGKSRQTLPGCCSIKMSVFSGIIQKSPMPMLMLVGSLSVNCTYWCVASWSSGDRRGASYKSRRQGVLTLELEHVKCTIAKQTPAKQKTNLQLPKGTGAKER